MRNTAPKEKYLKLLEFRHFERHILFSQSDRKEKKKQRKPKEVVAYARSKIGMRGYNILYNNCEHFANECVFGKAKSSTVDDVRDEIEKIIAEIEVQ